MMTLVEFLVVLLVAGIIGVLGQAIAGYSLGGCLVSIVVGFIGALLGVWLARTLGLPEFFDVRVGGVSFPMIWSIIGSALFVFAIALVNRRRLV
ncbi:MAG TPA: GlsB/YeaQ/YmgE family stress response membrane protein [Anaerolineales bacterium]|nr:GlsB/YeaQ/YmgE family stress response membrane protein [Anaerolineales bacterium]